MSTLSTWAYLAPSLTTAHRVEPAGGDGTWRTGCGRIVQAKPTPAAQPERRCARCVEQAAGSQQNRPAAR